MNPETRQSMIGVTGIVLIQAVALHEGFNGAVTTASLVAVLAIVAPEALDRLPGLLGGGK